MLTCLDTAVAECLECPCCSRPLTELGCVYPGMKFVPRKVAELKGVRIEGTLQGFQYACLNCRTLLFVPSADMTG